MPVFVRVVSVAAADVQSGDVAADRQADRFR